MTFLLSSDFIFIVRILFILFVVSKVSEVNIEEIWSMKYEVCGKVVKSMNCFYKMQKAVWLINKTLCLNFIISI